MTKRKSSNAKFLYIIEELGRCNEPELDFLIEILEKLLEKKDKLEQQVNS